MVTVRNIDELKRLLALDSSYLALAAAAVLADTKEAMLSDTGDKPFEELFGGNVHILEESDDLTAVKSDDCQHGYLLFNLRDPDSDPGYGPEVVREHGAILTFYFATHSCGGPLFAVDKGRFHEKYIERIGKYI